eukprot:9340663-Heterocapsa_arctica.AAC.1
MHSTQADGALWLQTSTTSKPLGAGPSPSRSSSAAELVAWVELLYLTALLIHRAALVQSERPMSALVRKTAWCSTATAAFDSGPAPASAVRMEH